MGGHWTQTPNEPARRSTDAILEAMPDPIQLPTLPVTETITKPVTDNGDHDRFAHYVRKADATRSAVEGTPVQALCGKVWVPHRDPDRYPICPTCSDIRSRLIGRRRNRPE